jgi:hypothetical protein
VLVCWPSAPALPRGHALPVQLNLFAAPVHVRALSWSRLEATDHAGLRYAICAAATELAKSEAGLVRL